MNVQMNVRIDKNLKDEGDAVFAAIGLSPTQVIRNIWQFAVDHREAPAIVKASLESSVGSFAKLEEELALREIDSAANLVADFRDFLGLPNPDVLEDLDYRGLRELALYERMTERGTA